MHCAITGSAGDTAAFWRIRLFMSHCGLVADEAVYATLRNCGVSTHYIETGPLRRISQCRRPVPFDVSGSAAATGPFCRIMPCKEDNGPLCRFRLSTRQ